MRFPFAAPLPQVTDLELQSCDLGQQRECSVAHQGTCSAAGRTPPPAQQEKVIAALTKAGITSPLAWAAAGIGPTTPAEPTVATGSSGAAAAPAPEFDLHPHTVLMKGTHNPAFFISWQSQRTIFQSLRWKSALMIWGGPALTLACVYMLAGQYGWL